MIPRVHASALPTLDAGVAGSAVSYDCYYGTWGSSPSHPCADPLAALEAAGGSSYVGHDEPDIQFYSSVAGSGNSMTWTLNLPSTDPTPTSSGSGVASYQLYPALWFSMSLCDPNSYPFGACTPNSDTNLGCTYPACTTANAGSALLELQFYPPDSPFNKLDFSQTSFPTPTKWTAAMTIDSFNNFLNLACIEPIRVAQITTNGLPSGTNLGMSPGDRIVVSLGDTASGLSAV